MASSRVSLNGPGTQDLAMMMEAFDAQNRVRTVLTGEACLTGGLADIRWQAQAMSLETESGEVSVLASVSATCLQGRFRTLEGLISYLLYQLDFQLAEHEWEKIKPAE